MASNRRADFEGSDKAAQLIDDVRRFLTEEIVPLEKAHGIGYEGLHPTELLRNVWKRSAEAGFYTLALPERLGGAGLNTVDTCLLKEAITATESVLAHHVLGEFSGPPRVGHLFEIATEHQLENYLLPVARAEKAVCFALTEIEAGSDAAAISTRAEREGDYFRLNGQKRYITGGAYADFAILFAVTDPQKGPKGVSAFFVDLDGPEVERNFDYESISGQRYHADFTFTDCMVPAANLLGEEGQGFKLAMSRITLNRLLHCSVMLGFARRAFDSACRHATTRRQFKRALADFQAIQHKLAWMETQLYAARGMMLHAAHLRDQGVDIRRQAAMCKYFIAENAFLVADQAMQVHGGVGIIKGHPVEWIFRMLRMYRIVTGTSEIQLNTIAKDVLKEYANDAPAVAGRKVG